MNPSYQHHTSPPPLHYRDGHPTQQGQPQPQSQPHSHYSMPQLPPQQSSYGESSHTSFPPGASSPQPQNPPQQGPPSQQQHNHYSMPQLPPHQPAYGEPAPTSFPPLAPGTQPVAPEPAPQSRVENGRRYELRVVQQPKRARMCGFGDKDRRPITPPPCVRLIITDAATGREIDCNEIDHIMFVLNVDLWSPDGTREVSLVKHSTSSPSISSTTPVSYSHMSDNGGYPSMVPGQREIKNEVQSYQNSPYTPYGAVPPVSPYGPPSQQQSPYGPPSSSYNQGYQSQNGGGYGQQQQSQSMYYNQPPQPSNYQSAEMAMGPGRPLTAQTTPQGMYTRNLIGSLAASAFRLTDPDDRIGIWFVLQDLSVRTEGNFRLRFSFVNVGLPTPPDHSNPQHPSPAGTSTAQINKGKAPVLASCFSEVFTVYSAKRFPGVVESTPLSKCFAHQGIKIPIRKDGAGGRGGRGEDDYDD